MRQGSDVPGRITRLPGGVAMNIAMTLVRFGMTPTLLTAIGRDPEGDELTYLLLAGPQGMAVDPANGALSWTPTAEQTKATGRQPPSADHPTNRRASKARRRRELRRW